MQVISRPRCCGRSLREGDQRARPFPSWAVQGRASLGAGSGVASYTGAYPPEATFMINGSPEVAMARYAFISRLGSVAYVAVTYDKNGGNLPSNIDGNKVEWSRIQTSHGEVFSHLSNSDMERDLHEAQIHITETRTTRRSAYSTLGRSER